MAYNLSSVKIGIIGGGQLGKMMVLEGKKLGIQFIILDPQADCPASSLVEEVIIGDYYDYQKIKELADKTHLVTYEFEHINADSLMELDNKGYKIYPSPNALKIIQDKYRQKLFLQEHGLPVPKFYEIEKIVEIHEAGNKMGFPLVLKNKRGGYDGKGNYVINSYEEIEAAYKHLWRDDSNLMVEAFVDFQMEISAIASRGLNGELKIYPLSENIHKDNILNTTIVPARISKETEEKAKKIALKTLEVFKSVGVFCIEMFVGKDGEVIINEIAPRVHNSGHYTIEGCKTSQFQQHIRSVLGLPLGSTDLINPSVMMNILGEENHYGTAKVLNYENLLSQEDVYLHIYGKKTTQPRRKMGHITIVKDHLKEALMTAEKIKDMVKIVSEEGFHE